MCLLMASLKVDEQKGCVQGAQEEIYSLSAALSIVGISVVDGTLETWLRQWRILGPCQLMNGFPARWMIDNM